MPLFLIPLTIIAVLLLVVILQHHNKIDIKPLRGIDYYISTSRAVKLVYRCLTASYFVFYLYILLTSLMFIAVLP